MFRLLFFPIYLVRKVLWKTIWHSVYFFLCRPWLLAIVAIGVSSWLGVSIWKADGGPVTLAPIAQDEQASPTNQYAQVASLPAFEQPIQNGNSSFAPSLFTLMKPDEKKFYSYHFQNAMGTMPADQPYRWMGHGGFFGEVTAKPAYIGKAGVTCRHFNEKIQTGKGAYSYTGLSCKQTKNNGWCKLRTNSAATCDIKPISGWTQFKLDTKGMFQRGF